VGARNVAGSRPTIISNICENHQDTEPGTGEVLENKSY